MRPASSGAAVGAGVDAEGEAADHDQAGAGQLAAELAGDLAPVGGGAAGADDGDRPERLEPAPAAPGRRGRPAPRARRRRRAAPRVELAVATAGPALGRPQLLREVALGQRRDPPQQLRGHLRRRRPRPGPRSPGAAAPASASRARRSRSARCRGRAGPAARTAAGTRGRRGAQPRSRLRSCSACAICSSPTASSAGQVGDRLRQPQRPVVGAAAEPLARVELGQQRRRGRAPRCRPARLGGRHLGVAAAGPEPPLLPLAGGADPVADVGRGLARGRRRSPPPPAGAPRRGCRCGRPGRR